MTYTGNLPVIEKMQRRIAELERKNSELAKTGALALERIVELEDERELLRKRLAEANLLADKWEKTRDIVCACGDILGPDQGARCANCIVPLEFDADRKKELEVVRRQGGSVTPEAERVYQELEREWSTRLAEVEHERDEAVMLRDAAQAYARTAIKRLAVEQFVYRLVSKPRSRMIDDLIKERDAAVSEAKHWKSNHAEVADRLRVFTQRPDLPPELIPRLPVIMKLQRRVAELEAAADEADNCAVLETSCKSCAKMIERMCTLEHELAEAKILELRADEERVAQNERLRVAFDKVFTEHDLDGTIPGPCVEDVEAHQHNARWDLLQDLRGAMKGPT